MTAHPRLAVLHPHAVHDLLRVGRDHDGGYVVCARTVHATDCLLGLGINLDWSFEREFLKCAPDARLIAVDGTVSFNRLLVRAMKGVIRTGLHLARGDVDQARYAWKTSREHARTALAFRRFFSAPTRRFHGDMMRERPGAGAMTWNELLARCAADIGEPDVRQDGYRRRRVSRAQ